jgi:hypothetical protein
MGFAKLISAAGAAALLTCVVATQSESQETARKRPPVVRIYSPNGTDVINTSSYVTPVIQVGENAYVFAVAMDLDGQIRVLHPDFPGISVKLAANRQVSLPNFFAGFNQPSSGSYYSSASYLGYDYNGIDDSRGTVIALASRTPFNLEKLEVGGDWNVSAIRRLIERRLPLAAAQSLAAYIGSPGEPIGRDFMRFAGGGNGYYASGYNTYDACDAYYGYGFGPLSRARALAQINYLTSRGIGYRIAGFDLCGTPIVVPTTRRGFTNFPVSSPPRHPGDTTGFPKARFPHEGVPRRPPGTNAAAEGVFPLPRRSGVGQIGDVTITAPAGRRGEPRQILEGYRATAGGTSIPLGRAPIERPVTPRTEPSVGGVEGVRQYRPEPRVQSPPPSRAPETPRTSSPPPVIHSAPPAPATRSEPPRVPPPNRQ